MHVLQVHMHIKLILIKHRLIVQNNVYLEHILLIMHQVKVHVPPALSIVNYVLLVLHVINVNQDSLYPQIKKPALYVHRTANLAHNILLYKVNLVYLVPQIVIYVITDISQQKTDVQQHAQNLLHQVQLIPQI